MTDQTPKLQDNNSIALTEEQKMTFRIALTNNARKYLNVKYHYAAEWVDYSLFPEFLDCSEYMEGDTKISGLPFPDGAQNQYNFTVATSDPKIGDYAFLAKGGNISKVYHVGMLLDLRNIIECRAFDTTASFETGKVIIRGRQHWETYIPNFVGFRSHPKLI